MTRPLAVLGSVALVTAALLTLVRAPAEPSIFGWTARRSDQPVEVRPVLPAATAVPAIPQEPPLLRPDTSPAPVSDLPATADPASHEFPDPETSSASPGPSAVSPITGVRIPRLRLDAEVVPAQVVDVPGGKTWEVPPFKVGHGELTAGAGEPGNAVLFGHLTSLDAGNVFRDLRLTRPGDVVEILSGQRLFSYLVVSVRSVPRTDATALQPTHSASVTLITCSGAWLPIVRDFSERLVVRADLAQPPAR